MEQLDYWRLCDELSIDQAAHLIIGMVPGEVEAMAANGSELLPRAQAEYITNLEAAQTAIKSALRRNLIKGNIFAECDHDFPIEGTVSLDSRVEVESLRKWLFSRGITAGFFFPNGTNAPDYLDPNNSRYAPKLAAAVRAWQVVTDLNGKTPKQALAKWLREHAAEFGMTDDEGKPNETGIEETAKVANWQPSGGAPKTPGE
ncbi:MAG: hypothetical protein IPP03_10460 [Dechloromonas sp.]|jgi:hypothetical protein|nr:hypothetical protein [Candidatus Dechloromonas phosphoritropha]MBP8789189.1 hypothetical protein [Azonexus sp.]